MNFRLEVVTVPVSACGVGVSGIFHAKPGEAPESGPDPIGQGTA
jgi:hypothetical protein